MPNEDTNDFIEEVNGYEEGGEGYEEAKSFGWKPPEDFSGENHMGAEAYMERGPGTSFKLQAEVKSLKEAQEAHAADMKAGYDDRLGRMERTMKAGEEARIEERANAIDSARRSAAESGDMEEYDRLGEVEKNRVGAPDAKPSTPTEAIPEADRRAIEAWTRQNPWFLDDPIANGEAIAYYDAFINRGMTTDEALKNVRARMELKSPYLFPQGRTAAAVDSGGLPGRTGGGKRWNDIPAEDRRSVDTEISSGDWNALAAKMKTTPQEAFASVYWEQE